MAKIPSGAQPDGPDVPDGARVAPPPTRRDGA
jgi:hypothetical protein